MLYYVLLFVILIVSDGHVFPKLEVVHLPMLGGFQIFKFHQVGGVASRRSSANLQVLVGTGEEGALYNRPLEEKNLEKDMIGCQQVLTSHLQSKPGGYQEILSL